MIGSTVMPDVLSLATSVTSLPILCDGDQWPQPFSSQSFGNDAGGTALGAPLRVDPTLCECECAMLCTDALMR